MKTIITDEHSLRDGLELSICGHARRGWRKESEGHRNVYVTFALGSNTLSIDGSIYYSGRNLEDTEI